MKRFYIITLLTFIASMFMSDVSAKQTPSKSNSRRAWKVEMQSVKTDYIAKKLDMTADQREKFTPVYRQMETELQAVSESTAALVDSVKSKGKAATDSDYRRAYRAAFDLKSKEAAIEKRYYVKFEQILTPAQMFSLKDAELQFTKELMKKHSSLRKSQRRNNDKK